MPFIEVDRVPMYYNVIGSGMPILFVHPPLLNSTNFIYQKQLDDQFQLITFDIRGHGLSGHSAQPLTYELIVNDMIQLLDFLSISKCYICGYSTGGGIALEAMLTHPHRFYGGILVSGMPEVNDWWLNMRISAAVTTSTRHTQKLLSFAIAAGNADAISTFMHLYRYAKKGNIDNIRQYYRASRLYRCAARLGEIHLPQLLIYGLKDKSFYRYATLLQRTLPQSELYFIKQSKHQIPTKAAATMNELMKQWVIKNNAINNKDILC